MDVARRSFQFARLMRYPAAPLLVAGLLLFGAGCMTKTVVVSVPRIERLEVIDPYSPATVVEQALQDRAEDYVATRPGSQAWRGKGLSMQPLLPPNAWVVTEPLPFNTLEAGQVVMFHGRHGRPVAHALVERTRKGWVTMGVNNGNVADRNLMTPANYLGVVTTAFIVQ